MIPDCYYCNPIKHQANPKVENKQQEIPIVIKPNAIIYPRAVMIIYKNTFVAYTAMMSSCRFDFVTFFALFITK
jgi:hypothetical protein